MDALPGAFVARLKAADEPALRAIAQQWASRMSADEFTHSASGQRIQDDWTLEDALSLLAPMAELAKKQQDDQSMYLLTEV